MSDDSFFREVDQELRQDQAKALWQRYGIAAIAAAILIVLATSAFVGYRYWSQVQANNSGDAFSQALAHAGAGRTEEALAALRELEAGGYGAYPVLARLRTATLLAESGDAAAAISAFDSVTTDTSVPPSIRDMARLRAAYLLVDHGSFEDVSARAEQLTADTHLLRHAAREALGLAAWRAGRSADALAFFSQIAQDEMAPVNTRQRAELMSELIRGSGAAS